MRFSQIKTALRILADYQPTMFSGAGSADKTIIRNAAYCAAKAAGILGIPVVLSAIDPQHNGRFIADVITLFPGQEVCARAVPGFDAFEDEKTGALSSGRAGRNWSSQGCQHMFTYTDLHALHEGYEIYGLMDAAGDSTHDAHKVRNQADSSGLGYPNHG